MSLINSIIYELEYMTIVLQFEKTQSRMEEGILLKRPQNIRKVLLNIDYLLSIVFRSTKFYIDI